MSGQKEALRAGVRIDLSQRQSGANRHQSPQADQDTRIESSGKFSHHHHRDPGGDGAGNLQNPALHRGEMQIILHKNRNRKNNAVDAHSQHERIGAPRRQ